MDDKALLEQARAIAQILPRLARRMFTIEPDDPGMVLPMAQMRVCTILRDGPCTMSTLSRELGISQSAMTQIADRLERSGMVERVPETADRRVKSLQLTADGSESMRRRTERRLRSVTQVLERLSPEAREAAATALQTLLDACPAPTHESGANPPLVDISG